MCESQGDTDGSSATEQRGCHCGVNLPDSPCNRHKQELFDGSDLHGKKGMS